MSESVQQAAKEVQRFLSAFKTLLPVLERFGSAEQAVKEAETRLTTLKMQETEQRKKVEDVSENLKLNQESLRGYIEEENAKAKKIVEAAYAKAKVVLDDVQKKCDEITGLANANRTAAEDFIKGQRSEVAKLAAEVGKLTEKRDGLKREISKIRETLGAS